MGAVLPVGTSTSVRVPGSSANLGPGFDCLGIALGVSDDVDVTVVDEGLTVEVTGEGAGGVPLDEAHLVVRALRRGLDVAGVSAPGLHVRCVNRIPHSRGLGSSAAAAVGGLAAASGLVSAAGVAPRFGHDELIQLSSEFEGHPDNAAASVLGGAVVSWTEVADAGSAASGADSAAEASAGGCRYFARSIPLHDDLAVSAFVPAVESSTSVTRGLLPDSVARADAVFNVSRSALAVIALSRDPECLFAATQDRLHQHYRAPVMRPSAELVAGLRQMGLAAVISGAGPTVLVLRWKSLPPAAGELAARLGFSVVEPPIADGVSIV
ncbi:homoserine kinase [Gordonia jinhuaensis]|uniref:Homoserine kinase n=1 Tax=Gordonia jinhuaensis TaxID=1517702 RepID=A0A916WNZ5_9ACTN|nr:homoserine kinase [Gordonia jinhuaensis]GGB16133.1 homoserine kinase [Gordonia jinhuaensis]